VSLSRAEADRLIAEADAESLLASTLIRLVLVAGLRIGSAISADISQLGYNRGHRVLRFKAKGNKRPQIPIPPFVSGPLDEMLAERGDPADGPLFITPREGVRVYQPYVWRLIRRLGRKAGIPQAAELLPHSLRHTAITALLEDGVALSEVQEFAGHADPRTTQLYNHHRGNPGNHGAYRLAAQFSQHDEGTQE
jgi:integrase/recombinase XerD